MEVSSIVPDLQGEVWLKSIRYPFLNRPIEANHQDIVRAARLGVFDIKARSFPTAVSDLRRAPAFTLLVITQTLEQAREFDLILATAQTMFVQIPFEVVEECGLVSALPGGYVEIGDSVQRRPLPGEQIYQWILPCQIVSPPGPDVVGTTMIWQTIFNAYGNWASLIAANPTWGDLLGDVASPEDTVVL